MTISLLNAVKAACGVSGIEPPVNVVANTDQTLRYLADESLRKLRQYQWQRLVKTGTVTMTTATDYALPADFWAYVPDTIWPIGGIRGASLPTTPVAWSILKSGIGINPAQFNVRFMADRIEIQNPTATTVLRYEYIQKYPITDSTGVTYKEAFTVDTDLCILDEELFIADLKWRVQQAKGISEWQIAKQDFDQYLRYRMGVDSGAKTLYPRDVRASTPQPPYNNDWVP
jgi:hypothetical protein